MRIGLDVCAFNVRGIIAYEKLGFKEEGRIKDDLYYNGVYHESILMGLMRRDYYQMGD
ncbi:hypothetical protein GLW08_19140 [Pontibacillus yanchengensis]|uniref:Uncharacterized protein n=1 Tax=Pontibacillus yanchengensis TaxID=462910 RepID=A0ACC7VKC9_9BACI|nr:hypothetical protein [Pontibacillus yanchengensis]